MSQATSAQKPGQARNGTAADSGYTTDAQRWRALQQRDPHADGHFVYSVATTGIYCRPACPSKLALREHIEFHETPADAERSGFRPCKRCRPDGTSQTERHAAAAATACRLIETSDPSPALAELAEAVGLSRHHFHRIFKEVVGITPRQYAATLQTEKVRTRLRQCGSVTEAIQEAGFSSGSRFYERSSETLGMTPSEFRAYGNGVEVRYAIAPCPLGLVLVAGTTRGICAVRFGDDRTELESELGRDFPRAAIAQADEAFDAWVAAVVRQIERPARNIDLPLDIRGTAFQQRVWQALREIPLGTTSTYAEVATSIGHPTAARAVARACATNPVAVVVPCHRVVRSDGGISGYRWGVERKRQLLGCEGAFKKRT